MTLPEASAIAERYRSIRAEVGPNVTVVVATKYVPLEEMGVLAEAGIEVVGENRAQDLARKHERYADAFRWHFIGRLQSNKVKEVNPRCELVHSLDSDSAAKRLTIPALLEVDLGGEETKAGVPASEIAGFLERHPNIRGLMTMPPLAYDSGGVTPVLPAAPRIGARARSRGAEHGNVAGLPGRGGGGSDARAGRGGAFQRDPKLESRVVGFSDLWNRTLVYFGIAEVDEWDENGYPSEELEQTARPA